MNINFEALTQIPKLVEIVLGLKATVEAGTIEKRWLNTKEVAIYTGHEHETIKTKIKSGKFIKEYHYFKRDGMLLFDLQKVDEWAMGKSPVNNSLYQDTSTPDRVDEILASIA